MKKCLYKNLLEKESFNKPQNLHFFTFYAAGNNFNNEKVKTVPQSKNFQHSDNILSKLTRQSCFNKICHYFDTYRLLACFFFFFLFFSKAKPRSGVEIQQ